MSLWIAPGEAQFIAAGNTLYAVRPDRERWLTVAIGRAGEGVLASSRRRVAAYRLARRFAQLSPRPWQAGLHHNVPRDGQAWPVMLWPL